MTWQILLNLIIAMVWMLLHDVWNAPTFAIGYVIGLLFIFGLRRFFTGPFYMKKLWSIIKLFYIFNVELIVSSVVVIMQIIQPKLSIKPGIIKMTTKLKSDWELTLLSYLLTLTPGSVVLEIAPREGIMYLHAMDVADLKQLIRTKERFEKVILEVMS